MKKEFKKRLLSTIILIPLSFFFIIKGSIYFNLFLTFCFLLTSYEWYKMSIQKKYHFFGYLFLIISFYSAYTIRNDFGEQSLLFFLLIISICIATDIGGYVFGKTFKGPKITKISPSKTYAGMIGGYLLSIIITYILLNYSFILDFDQINFSKEIFVIILFISTISQLGDMTISFFKRLSKIKDTGKIIPGHGGILDRIDGMIFAFPFSYLIYSINI